MACVVAPSDNLRMRRTARNLQICAPLPTRTRPFQRGLLHPNDAIAHVTGDAFFVCPTRHSARAAVAAGAPVFRYSFEQPLEAPFMQGLGVFHSAELPFVFGNDDYPLGRVGASGAPVSAATQDYWTTFAKTGDPNSAAETPWPAYDAATDAYQMIATPIANGTQLKTALCDFWDALPAN